MKEMSDFEKFIDKMLEDIELKIVRAGIVSKNVVIILEGKCPDCGKIRTDNDQSSRCRECRTSIRKHI